MSPIASFEDIQLFLAENSPAPKKRKCWCPKDCKTLKWELKRNCLRLIWILNMLLLPENDFNYMCELPRPSCFSHASLVLLGCRNITVNQLLYPLSSTIMLITSKTIRIISISTIIILLITMLKVT